MVRRAYDQRSNASPDSERLHGETESKTWALTVQLIYLVGLVAATAMIFFIYLFLVPMLNRMIDEFGFNPNQAYQFLEQNQHHFQLLGMALLLLFVIYLALVLLCSLWPSRRLLRMTPWFGHWLRTRGQGNALVDFSRWYPIGAIAGGRIEGDRIQDSLALDSFTAAELRILISQQDNRLPMRYAPVASSTMRNLNGFIPRALQETWLTHSTL